MRVERESVSEFRGFFQWCLETAILESKPGPLCAMHMLNIFILYIARLDLQCLLRIFTYLFITDISVWFSFLVLSCLVSVFRSNGCLTSWEVCPCFLEEIV